MWTEVVEPTLCETGLTLLQEYEFKPPYGNEINNNIIYRPLMIIYLI